MTATEKALLEEVAYHLYTKQDIDRVREMARAALAMPSPEVEREYGVQFGTHGLLSQMECTSLESAQRVLNTYFGASGEIVSRIPAIPAGPWEPISA